MTLPEQGHKEYALGHSAEELVRLDRQGAFVHGLTSQIFSRAGIGPGMRVLDFGTGTGDTALLAGALVGPTGEVVGFDRSAAVIDIATANARAKGYNHVRFVTGDEQSVPALLGGRPFDALVGRLVLVHQPDPVESLAAVARLVRPGGILAFHEIDIEGRYWTSHPNPFLEQLWRWIDGIAARGIFAVGLGRKLHEAFDALGAEDRLVMWEGRHVRATDPDANAWLGAFARSISGLVERLGIACPSDAPIDALLEQLASDPAHAAAYNVPVYLVGATTCLPSR